MISFGLFSKNKKVDAIEPLPITTPVHNLLPPKTFYLISASGMPNYGDDMLTRGWINHIKLRYPQATIYLDAVDPLVAATLYQDVKCVNYLWQLAQALGEEGSIETKFSDTYLLPMRERLMSEIFEETDSIHLLGGGYINELWAANLRLIELVSYFGKKHNALTYATGLGLQPLSDEKAAYLSQFIKDYFCFDVRDYASYHVLEKYLPGKISFIGDDYFCFPFSDVVSLVERDNPVLRLCLHNEFSEGDENEIRFMEQVEAAIGAFIQKFPDSLIRFYEFRPGSDGYFYKRLKQKFPSIEMVFFETIWKHGLQFSMKDFFLSTRFHFQLIVSSVGLSGTSFYWSEYYKNKFDSLKYVTDWSFLKLGEESLNLDSFFENHGPAFLIDFGRVNREKKMLADRLYASSDEQDSAALSI
ncbi:polysaccharide pyruvyl transferase family protein [Rahnella sp. C60]|uniref:polysaccharide pyruvyl transferase family protein n=1 Tax=Rahnella perminowiae TaxID=2816244 RepID=UPI001C252A87|nr:polysaccharide pyruvyl transferase family protein [Rahnella perminowiae]MBU9815440.1 polysaccharide pyruvyl transferase family protein [Rahnella perminowiae]